MIVREPEGGQKALPGISTTVMPQSLASLSPDLQERLLLATANRLLAELKECIKANTGDVEGVLVKICTVNCSVTSKCRNLQLWSIFHHSCKGANDLPKIHQCFSTLEKYGYNLLRSRVVRPDGWQAISVRNNSFANKVDTIQGARDILKEFGYSVETPDGLRFPVGAEPVVDNVVALLAEVSVVKCELDIYICCLHPYPQHWESLIPPQARLEQKRSGSSAGSDRLISSFAKRFERDKTPSTPPSSMDEEICDNCGTKAPEWTCESCQSKQLCTSCDHSWHSHPRRTKHNRSPYSRRQGPPQVGIYSYVTDNVPAASEDDLGSGIYAEIPDRSLQGSGVYELMPNADSIPQPVAPKPALPPRPPTLLKGSEIVRQRTPNNMQGNQTGSQMQRDQRGNQAQRDQRGNQIQHNRTGNELGHESDDNVYSSIHDSGYLDPVEARAEVAPPHFEMTQNVMKGTTKISKFIEELKNIDDPIEKRRRGQVMISEFGRQIDQFAQELKQILKNTADFESNAEYKRLIGEKSRLERNRLLLEEYLREVEEEMRKRERMLREPPKYQGPQPSRGVDVSDVYVQYDPTPRFDFEAEWDKPTPQLQDFAWPTQSGDVVDIGAGEASWECEHCTIRNPATERVCSVCCRTSTNPKRYGPPQTMPKPSVSQRAPPETKPFQAGSKTQSSPQLSTTSQATPETSRDRKQLVYHSQVVSEEQDEIFLLKQKAKAEWERKQKGLPPLEEQPPAVTPPMHKANTVLIDVNLLMEQPVYRPEPDYLRHGATERPRRRSPSQEVQLAEQMAEDARDVARAMREVETRGLSMEDLEIALVHSPPKKAFHWLVNELPIMLNNLLETAKSRLSSDLAKGMTVDGARSALIDAEGDFDLAVTMCVAKRQAILDKLAKLEGAYSRQQVLDALRVHAGNEHKACVEIQRAQCDQIRESVWQSAPGNGDVTDGRHDYRGLDTVLKNKQEDFERRARMVLVEAELQGWGRAENVIRLLDEGLEATLEEVVHSVRDQGTLKFARQFLQQECSMCFGDYPANQILTLNMCECRTCMSCMKTHFDITIRERHVKNLNCPSCQSPDIEDVAIESEYLGILTIFLKELLNDEVYGLYEDKLRDWNLQKDPNFRWCSHCENGFIFKPQGAHPNRFKMTCTTCGRKTCFKCKKKWEDQHNGVTCEQFKRWQEENDPDFQEKGLAKHLQENGIDCPSCKMNFALAKGGCMHFKCTQCGHEFCCGCSQAFLKGEACKQYGDCAKAGLHCHHPRDCLYYLRDASIEHLQKLLKDNDVNFLEDNQENQKCTVMEQKETPNGLEDDPCGRDVQGNQAGLCKIHYKEYLVSEINRNHIDPVVAMVADDIIKVYGRHRTAAPGKARGESEDVYATRLREDVQQKFPLPRQATI